MKMSSFIRTLFSLIMFWGIHTATAQNFHVWNEGAGLSTSQPLGAKLVNKTFTLSSTKNAVLNGVVVTFSTDASQNIVASVKNASGEVLATNKTVFFRQVPGGGTEIAFDLDTPGDASLNFIVALSRATKVTGKATINGEDTAVGVLSTLA